MPGRLWYCACLTDSHETYVSSTTDRVTSTLYLGNGDGLHTDHCCEDDGDFGWRVAGVPAAAAATDRALDDEAAVVESACAAGHDDVATVTRELIITGDGSADDQSPA